LTLAAAAHAVTPLTFAHISDTHIAAGGTADTNLQAAIGELNAMEPRPAFVIHTGDVTEMGTDSEFERYKSLISGALMPIHHSPGNHETRWSDNSINRHIAQLGPTNISFLHNGVRFIGFNAAIWVQHHGAASGDARRWIVEQLAQDPPGTPAVLFTHQPPMYPDNVYFTGDVELFRAIRPFNVRLFLNGHGHIFKQWTVDGIFCKMTKGMMNDGGGYTLYEVGTDEIRVYDKRVGFSRELVARVPLAAPRAGVAVEALPAGEGALEFAARVTPNGLDIARVEWQTDHHEHPQDSRWTALTAEPDGTFRISVPAASLVPGRHTLAVRAVDADGGAWLETVPVVREDPSLPSRVFDAGTALQGPAAAAGDLVVAGGWDGAVYAVETATLQQRWRFATGGAVIGRPEIGPDTVYAGSTDTNVYAIDRITGQERWRFPTGGPIQGHLTLADGALFFASGDHNLYAVDAATGAKRWSYPMGHFAQARPAYANGVVYIGCWDQRFYAIDAQTGRKRWSVPIGSIINYAPAVTSPCVVNGRVIVTAAVSPSGTTQNNIRCFDAQTGEEKWGKRLASGASPYGSPTSDGYRVYCTTIDGMLYALRLSDGLLLWNIQMGEIVYDCSPVAWRGQVICNTMYGGLEGHSAATGALLWRYKTGAGLQFSWPTPLGGRVYLTSMDGTLTEVAFPNTLAGDANSDGRFGIDDVILAFRAAAGLGQAWIVREADVAPFPSSDARGFGDGTVDVPDALRLLRHLNDLDNAPPWG
jgi:outer membrane protein assembly factor BamB/predicted phosphodiesterase